MINYKTVWVLSVSVVFCLLLSCSKKHPVAIVHPPDTDTADTVTVADTVKLNPMQAILGVYEGWHKHMRFVRSGGDTSFYLNEATVSRAIINRGSTNQKFTVSLYVPENGKYIFNFDGGMYQYVEGETAFPVEAQEYGKPYVSIIFTGDSVKYSYLYVWTAHNLGRSNYETINGGWKKSK